MGLDMYLHKAKRINGVTPEQLVCIDNYFSYLERPEKYSNSTMKDWCGIDIEEVNISLVEDYRNEYVKRFATWDSEKNYGWKTIIETVADWRKANHIHKWFVDNVQKGVDDCGNYEVTKEQLEKLLDICKRVINESNLVKGKVVNGQKYENGKMIDIYQDGEYVENYSVAKKLLPTTSGFFFGSTQYDQWYIEDVKHTIEFIENVISTTDFEHEIVMYHSSW